MKRQARPILVIDSSTGCKLASCLGLHHVVSLKEVVSDYKRLKIRMSLGIFRKDLLNLKFNDAVTETDGLDLVSIGGTDERGCNCFVSEVLGDFFKQLIPNYRFVVIDNAIDFFGLHNPAVKHVDQLLVLSRHSMAAFNVVKEYLAKLQGLGVSPVHTALLINMTPSSGIDEALLRALNAMGHTPLASIPWDIQVDQFNNSRKPLMSLPDNSLAVLSVDSIMNNTFDLQRFTYFNESHN